jgi:hypothetical protein
VSEEGGNDVRRVVLREGVSGKEGGVFSDGDLRRCKEETKIADDECGKKEGV